jgi:hypothetical protein
MSKFGSACHFFPLLHALCFADVAFRTEFDWLADPEYYPIKKCGNDGAKR